MKYDCLLLERKNVLYPRHREGGQLNAFYQCHAVFACAL